MRNDAITKAMAGKHLVQAAFGGGEIILNFHPSASINICSYELFIGANSDMDVLNSLSSLFGEDILSVKVEDTIIYFHFSGNKYLLLSMGNGNGESIIIDNELGVSIY